MILLNVNYMVHNAYSWLRSILVLGFAVGVMGIEGISQNLGFSYQAIARNDNGDPLTSQSLQISIQIRRNAANGNVVYEENHTVETNALGLFTLVIGTGDTQTGNFNNINWGGNTYFVRVGVNGTALGATRLEAVPYSKVATHMDLEDLQDVVDDNPSSGQVLTWNGNAWEPRNSQSGFNPEAGSGISINGNTITNTGDTNPDNDITESSQAGGDLSGTFDNLNIRNNTIGTGNIINGSITTDDIDDDALIPGPPTGSAGGDLDGNYPNPEVDGLRGRTVQDVAPSNNQVLTWTGSAWAPRDVPTSGGAEPTGNAGGDLDGIYPNPEVDGIRGRAIQDVAPTSDQVLTWTGSAWAPRDVPATGGPPSGAAGGDLAGTYPDPSVDGLQGNPVSNSTPSENQVLTFISGQWTPRDVPSTGGGAPSGPAGGDLTGTYPNPTVDAIQGKPVSTNNPAANQVLTWDGIQWLPKDVPTSGGGSPTGSASGDLGGTYPGPSVVALQGNPVSDDAPGTDQVLTWDGSKWLPQDLPTPGGGSPTGSAGGDLGGTYPDPTVDGLQGRSVAATAPSNNQVLTWNDAANAWIPQDAAGSDGSISVPAEGDIRGTYPTLQVVGIQGNAVSNALPASDQVLTWEGNQWIPKDLPTSGGGSPSGDAGGDLGGTYPNPTVIALQGESVTNDDPAENNVLAYINGSWTPSPLANLIVDNGAGSFEDPSSLLRQASLISAVDLPIGGGQDILSLSITTSSASCALVTFQGQAHINDTGSGGFAQLDFGVKQGTALSVNTSSISFAIPTAFPSATPFYQAFSITRKISLPAGTSSVEAFATNALSGESINISGAALTAHIITDTTTSCNP